MSGWIVFFFKWKENLGKNESHWGKSCPLEKKTKKNNTCKCVFLGEPYFSGTTELNLETRR